MRHQPNKADRMSLSYNPKSPYRRVVARFPIGPGTSCVGCGWPFKDTSSVLLAGRNASGEAQFKHALCPSLSERRRMRAEALA